MNLLIGLLLLAVFCQIIMTVLKGLENMEIEVIPKEGNKTQGNAGREYLKEGVRNSENSQKSRTIDINEDLGIIYSDGSVEEDNN